LENQRILYKFYQDWLRMQDYNDSTSEQVEYYEAFKATKLEELKVIISSKFKYQRSANILEFLIQDTKKTTEDVHKKFEGQLKDLKLMSNIEVENMV
jgi:hypothetical protein